MNVEQPTVKLTRIPRSSQPYAADRPARSAARPRLRGATGAGLLAALALTALSTAGTAHADDRAPKPQPAHAGRATPSPVPTTPGPDGSATPSPRPTSPESPRPTAVPSVPGPRPTTAAPSVSPTAGPKHGDGPKVNPAPAKGRDGDKELAHTGASSATTLALGGGAAALIAAGGGAVYAARRQRG
ncbi:LAETG motif-containing sortase-dependent surface protein [Streptomyces inhibens]|uniref:LAETG motif-containing sortase-dependent surface protein n=1 Tax=Streptomyces inhibens TaxID=2293571 RepID=UPI00402ACFB5